MEIMEKQTQLLDSKLMIFTTLVLFLFITCNKQPIPSKFDNQYNSSVIKDTAVNKFILQDTLSILRQVGDISELIEDDFNLGECVTLFNNSESEYLKLKREYGGFNNQYSYFYVGYKNEKVQKSKILRDSNFTSNKGAFLGMLQEDFLKKYSEIAFNKVADKDTITYVFINKQNIYEARYVFVNNKLIKFEFGYQD
ncbi:hypothetical protein O2K51_05270 [Apibacter raozihei]|uniref:hypothetical protein n=2 Tax=Apibacter raozihei TaxID=2500547 RepID=UPI0013E2EDAB|nr:hypothetical protein [Apibacter raozihei]